MTANQVNAGAFGQGRGQVQAAEYQSNSDMNRAALQANLLNQGYGQAQNMAQNQFANQINLGQQNQNMHQH